MPSQLPRSSVKALPMRTKTQNQKTAWKKALARPHDQMPLKVPEEEEEEEEAQEEVKAKGEVAWTRARSHEEQEQHFRQRSPYLQRRATSHSRCFLPGHVSGARSHETRSPPEPETGLKPGGGPTGGRGPVATRRAGSSGRRYGRRSGSGPSSLHAPVCG